MRVAGRRRKVSLVSLAEADDRSFDLTVFQQANAKAKTTGRRMGWAERSRLIRLQFGVVAKPEWSATFRTDIDLFGRVLRDILKADQATPGRDGPRPGLDYERGVETLRQLLGQDYSMLPFAASFRLLAGKTALTALARKTGISRSRVHRLLSGQDEPTVDDMQSIANAFGKDASWFSEYRSAFITAALYDRLVSSPETNIGLYQRLINS